MIDAADGTCIVCKEPNIVVCFDTSDGEYDAECICLDCFSDIYRKSEERITAIRKVKQLDTLNKAMYEENKRLIASNIELMNKNTALQSFVSNLPFNTVVTALNETKEG